MQVRSRAYFSTYHLWAARDFSAKCAAIESVHHGPSRFDHEHRALVIAAVVESASFLESAINELFKDCVDDHHAYVGVLAPAAIASMQAQWATWHNGPRAAPPTLGKYDAALRSVGLNQFDHSTGPYQDAVDVLNLRNALVHFTPEWSPASGVHRFDSFKSKFEDNRLMRGSGNAYFPDKCLGAGCAAWAAKSSRSFVDAFHEKLGIRPNYQRSPELRDRG